MVDKLFIDTLIAERHRAASAASLAAKARRKAEIGTKPAHAPQDYYLPSNGLSWIERSRLRAYNSRFASFV